jgi:hypothetical protein
MTRIGPVIGSISAVFVIFATDTLRLEIAALAGLFVFVGFPLARYLIGDEMEQIGANPNRENDSVNPPSRSLSDYSDGEMYPQVEMDINPQASQGGSGFGTEQD